MKDIVFLGDSLSQIRAFPRDARQNAGFQIDRVQRGHDPDDWKPMKAIGKGAREIRIREASGIYRVIYLAKIKNAVYVVHAFQKKSQKTSKLDIDLARKRLKEIGDSND